MKTIDELTFRLTSEQLDRLYFLIEDFKEESLKDKEFFQDILNELILE